MKNSSTYSLEQVFAADGLLAKAYPQFEFRPEQMQMAEAVAEVMRDGGHLCVEAGTGTGKTLAYLVPALLSDCRVVVSTGTKALQEQLWNKDLPLLSEALQLEIAACVVKGRNNYLCLERLDAARHSPLYSGLFPEESLAQIVRWARKTETGDRAELGTLPEEFPEWRHLDARREICLGAKCRFFQDCFVTRVRQKAAESSIIIVNHHLFFADLAIRDREAGRVLPEYRIAVFDEAHQLEDIAAQFLGVSVNNFRFEEWRKDLDRVLENGSDEGRQCLAEADSLMNRAGNFFSMLRMPGSEGGKRRLYGKEGQRPEELAQLEETVQLSLSLRGMLHRLSALTGDAVEVLHGRLYELGEDLDFILNGSDSGYAYWQETRGRGVFLQAAPIRVSEHLAEKLFSQVRTAVLTSATLSTDGHFQFIRDRLGLELTMELVLGSPFCYQRQAILYIPRDICNPREREFAEAMAAEVQEILSITQGRAFVLFTSYQQMQRVYGILERILPFPLLVQGEGTAGRLLEEFRETPHCVLFGTTSFWQGVDVQGQALSCVILEKLPFSVPSEPMLEARLEDIREQGGDPFNSYQVPEAIILLKQGLGRLLRSRSDRGALCIMDRRILTHSYGRQFRLNLPPCPVTHDLEIVRRFFRDSDFE
jgi:ATP-dependent DNA helicase DinG